MTDENQFIRRRLPPELLAEIHKCLPLADATNVLVNVPTRAIYQNNSPRMRRTIQRLKTFFNEYIGTLVNVQKDNNRKALIVRNEIEWSPQFYALLRYGSLTSWRQWWMWLSNIVGVPENFLGELFLYLANSSLPKMMLHHAEMNFSRAPLPIPSFLEQLFKEKQYQSDGRILFETVQLEAGNGQFLCIFEAELQKTYSGNYLLRLLVISKMDRKNWFQITMTLDSTKKFIRRLVFTQWPLDEIDLCKKLSWSIYDELKQNGSKLEAKGNILWNSKLDMFLRRGVAFTKFRHFKINENYHIYRIPTSYVDFLISYISNTKYPEQFLQSIDIQFSNCLCSSFIDKIYPNEIPKGGKFINVGSNKKLHILSAVKPEMKQLEGSSTIGEYKLEFTLANLATNGKYVFDFDVQTKRGFSRIIGMKIQKRMVDEIAESNYNDNGQNEKGKKRKITKEEEKDKPTYYSGKIMKK